MTGPIARLRARVGDEVLAGIAVVTVAVLVFAATALFYLRPPSKTSFTFLTTDAAAVTGGEDVRVAGISVGQITAVELQPDRVEVTASVEDSTFIGDQSRIEVRMLTPVGGYAVTLIPLGQNTLGDKPIPVGNVTMPYTIADVLQEVPAVTDDVAAEPIDASLIEVAEAFSEHPSSIADIAEGTDAITRVMDRQQKQVETIMALSSEYLTSFNANRDFIFDLIRQIDIVVETYHVSSAGFNEAYALLGDVLMRVAPFEEYYLDNEELVVGMADRVRESIDDLNEKLGPALDNLMSLRGRLADWLTPAGIAEIAGGTIALNDICLPVAGKEC